MDYGKENKFDDDAIKQTMLKFGFFFFSEMLYQLNMDDKPKFMVEIQILKVLKCSRTRSHPSKLTYQLLFNKVQTNLIENIASHE